MEDPGLNLLIFNFMKCIWDGLVFVMGEFLGVKLKLGLFFISSSVE